MNELYLNIHIYMVRTQTEVFVIVISMSSAPNHVGAILELAHLAGLCKSALVCELRHDISPKMVQR